MFCWVRDPDYVQTKKSTVENTKLMKNIEIIEMWKLGGKTKFRTMDSSYSSLGFSMYVYVFFGQLPFWSCEVKQPLPGEKSFHVVLLLDIMGFLSLCVVFLVNDFSRKSMCSMFVTFFFDSSSFFFSIIGMRAYFWCGQWQGWSMVLEKSAKRDGSRTLDPWLNPLTTGYKTVVIWVLVTHVPDHLLVWPSLWISKPSMRQSFGVGQQALCACSGGSKPHPSTYWCSQTQISANQTHSRVDLSALWLCACLHEPTGCLFQ